MKSWGVILCLPISLMISTLGHAQVVFELAPDNPDPRLRQASWDDLLSSPLGDEVPFMLGGVCRFESGPEAWLVEMREANPLLLLGLRPNTPFAVVDRELGPPLHYSGCAVGDINGDGLSDLVALASSHGVDLFKANLTAPGFSLSRSTVAGGPSGMLTSPILGDYDNDGDLDLVVLQWSLTEAIHLFENNGKGAFSDVTTARKLDGALSYGFSGGFADIDNDGWLDLLIAADFGNSRVFLNRRGLWFDDVTSAWNAGTDENGMGSAIGDIDGDGDVDWFVTSIFDPSDTCSQFKCDWGTTGNRLYINEGGTHFRDATDEYNVRDGGWGWGASFLDYDNDGDLDLAMTNGIQFADTPIVGPFSADKVRLWRNEGSPPMTEVSEEVGFEDDRSGKGLTVFDFENDGDLDVFMVNNADYPAFFRNISDTTHAWLRVELQGNQSNTQGYGARISVKPEPSGPTQVREVNANNNYLSQNEAIAHFGLGAFDGPIAVLRVFWPASGTETVLRDVASRRKITIQERTMGDLTDDGQIDLRDFARWMNCWGEAFDENSACIAGDFNADQAIDLADWQTFVDLLK